MTLLSMSSHSSVDTAVDLLPGVREAMGLIPVGDLDFFSLSHAHVM